ncbi:MAG: hypothetical protein C0503_06130 [Gemmatimonas sp.]|nr:hypothetical protein [Gemmatimonas sp.]
MPLVLTHVLSALAGLILGVAALTFPNGSPRHRAIGKAYLGAWLTVATSGFLLGADTPALSTFEILTMLGVGCVAFAFAAVRLRRRIGPRWLRWHYVWMSASIAALVITSVNQTILQTWGPYPRWLFWALVLAPIAILPPYHRALDRRFQPGAAAYF